MGYGSRKDIGVLVKQGRVTLNGTRVTKADASIDLTEASTGALLLDGQPVDPPAPLTVMLHKPAGYSCSHDEKGALIYDLLPERWKLRKPSLSTAGRLDKDSTGQVILTDDGDLLHRIIHPKSHASKHYEVTLAEHLRGDEATLFATGTFLMEGDPKPLKPAQWQPGSKTSGVMILQEGRYHQIRRMFKTLGNRVETLHRVQTGKLMLADLGVGQIAIKTLGVRERALSISMMNTTDYGSMMDGMGLWRPLVLVEVDMAHCNLLPTIFGQNGKPFSAAEDAVHPMWRGGGKAIARNIMRDPNEKNIG
eukprot:gene14062-14180_t